MRKEPTEVYVCGLLFSKERTHIALILSATSEWQEGRFNGIGGRVGELESIESAMIREFKEETGLYFNDWSPFAQGDSLDGQKRVIFWRGFDDKVFKIKSKTGERIVVLEIKNIDFRSCIPNLSWLIPLALDTTTISLVKFKF